MVDNPSPGSTSTIPINPTVSLIGSGALFAAGALVGWLATHNIIPAADVTQDTAVVASILVGAIGAGVGYFKMKQAAPDALIKQVNADLTNGVKVVPVSSPTPAVPVSQPVQPTSKGT